MENEYAVQVRAMPGGRVDNTLPWADIELSTHGNNYELPLSNLQAYLVEVTFQALGFETRVVSYYDE